MKRTIIYARVSTDEQAEHGYSLQSQIEACERYAHVNELTVTETIKDDYSGAKLDRPGLDKIRDLIKKKQIEAVIVFSPDRLTRQLAHSLILREEWHEAGIELHYCNRGKSENTTDGRMVENIEAVFADYWRGKIIESSRRGRLTKAANGKWPCDGQPAYGYKRIGKGRDAHQVINEDEAAVVRRIFDLYVGINGNPMSLQLIAKMLTAEGVSPPNRGSGIKKPGTAWYRSTIRTIIIRRSYIGEFKYSGHEMMLPELAFIPKELFELAQTRRRNMKGYGTRLKKKHEYLLASHISCVCGLSMHGQPMAKGRYLYYQCSSVNNRPHVNKCPIQRIRTREVDGPVWDWVTALLCDVKNLEAGAKKLSEGIELEVKEKEKRINTINRLIGETARKIDRLAKAFADEDDDMIGAAFRQEMKTEKQIIEALEEERSVISNEIHQQRISNEDVAILKQLATQITARLQEPSFEMKRRLLNLLDVRIRLNPNESDDRFTIWCRLSPALV